MEFYTLLIPFILMLFFIDDCNKTQHQADFMRACVAKHGLLECEHIAGRMK